MRDLLVRLYDLPPFGPAEAALAGRGITLRRPLPWEKHLLLDWVEAEFGRSWRSECEVAFARQPVSCFAAAVGGRVLGFACYEVTARGFFGPMGVATAERGSGVGEALLLASLHAMREHGYVYAIIGGGDGAREFYERTVGATVIEGSERGVYRVEPLGR